jgi:SAM-dependent methyltransferase
MSGSVAPPDAGAGVTSDPEAVRAFEHAGWQRAAAEYDATFAPASAQFVEMLLEVAAVGAGTRLLDLCCGTGVATAAAAARGADAIGVDFSTAMLEAARRAHPRSASSGATPAVVRRGSVEFRGASPAASRPGASRDAAGVASGGRIAFTTWALPEVNIAGGCFSTRSAFGDLQAAKRAFRRQSRHPRCRVALAGSRRLRRVPG